MNKIKPKEPLRLIINGVAGTGKSYLINGLYNTLKDKCIVTATTGKASYNINGVTIHSLLRLPIASATQKDLSGQPLSTLKEKLLHTDYLLIDVYSTPVIVIPSVNQGVTGSDHDQILPNGETTQDDWKQFLASQPSKVRDIHHFQDVVNYV